MSLVNELREDLRLARLNNPRHEWLFKLLGLAGGLFKVVMLAAFGLGIWHILYGVNSEVAERENRNFVAALNQAELDRIAAASTPVAPLTAERIDMLKQFAEANQPVVGAGEEANSDIVSPPSSVQSAATDAQPGNEPEIMAAMNGNEKVTIRRDLRPAVVKDRRPIVKSHAEWSDVVPAVVEQRAMDTKPLAMLDIADISALEDLQKKLTEPDPAVDDVPSAKDADSALIMIGENNKDALDRALELPSAPGEVLAAAKDKGASPVVPETSEAEVVKNDTWMLKQNPAHYTIQIGSTVNKPYLISFSEQLPEGQPAAVYEYVFRDRPEYGLSYGIYNDAEEARAALNALEPGVRRYGAFTRKIEILHRQMNRVNRQLTVSR